MKRKLAQILILVLGVGALLFAVQGCGFHLRGAVKVKLSPALDRTYIDGNANSRLVQALTLRLQASGAKVVDTPAAATAVLKILHTSFDRRVLAVDDTAKVREYEVSLTVDFAVIRADGAELLPRQQLVVVRDYSFDENDVLGKVGEEGLLRKEMERNLVGALMRRLEYIKAR